jgi:hypothetical protein
VPPPLGIAFMMQLTYAHTASYSSPNMRPMNLGVLPGSEDCRRRDRCPYGGFLDANFGAESAGRGGPNQVELRCGLTFGSSGRDVWEHVEWAAPSHEL